MKKLILLLVPALLLNCSNDDDNPSDASACLSSLPPITQTGENTFGACINNLIILPRDGSGTLSGGDDAFSFLGGYPNATDYYEIDVRDFKSPATASMLIHIQAIHLNGVGDYIIDESNGNHAIDGYLHNYLHCRVFNADRGEYQYYRSFENSGLIKITSYNYQAGLLAGTFECRVKNVNDPNDIIEIKDGRFDINGYTLPNTVFP